MVERVYVRYVGCRDLPVAWHGPVTCGGFLSPAAVTALPTGFARMLHAVCVLRVRQHVMHVACHDVRRYNTMGYKTVVTIHYRKTPDLLQDAIGFILHHHPWHDTCRVS